MGRSPQLETTLLVSLLLQAILYGVYLYTCFYTAASSLLVHNRSGHTRWRTPGETSWTFLFAGILLFLNTAANVAIQLYVCLAAFAYKEDLATLMKPNSGSNLVKGTQVMFQIIVADFILVYRVYIVYRQSIIVTLPPLVLWLANVGISIKCMVFQSTTKVNLYCHWYTASWALSITFNIISTLLLLYRLRVIDLSLPVNHRKKREEETKLRLFMRSIVESGLMYCVAVSAVELCQAVNALSLASVIVNALALVTVAIAFNLILMRCASIIHSNEETTHHDEEHTLTAIGPMDFSNTVGAAVRAFNLDDLNSAQSDHGHHDSRMVNKA